MVSNANEDLPDPDKPVKTIRASRGSSSVRFLRLCSRAPWMTRESVPTVPECNEGRRQPVSLSGPALRHTGFAQLAKFLAQLVDLVAEPGRVLEPEVTGRLMHLLLESLDQALEFLGGDALRRLDDPLFSGGDRGLFASQ